jgi:site-specific recombinase XerD
LETDLGKRDRAILEFLYATGMRVGELVNLNLKDIDFREKLVRVTGKRKKQRILPFGEPSLQGLDVLSERSPRRFSRQLPARRTRRTSRFFELSGNAHHDSLSWSNG